MATPRPSRRVAETWFTLLGKSEGEGDWGGRVGGGTVQLCGACFVKRIGMLQSFPSLLLLGCLTSRVVHGTFTLSSYCLQFWFLFQNPFTRSLQWSTGLTRFPR